MMISKDKLEGYMIKLSLNFEEISENTWLINDLDKGLENVVVLANDSVVVIRVKVMEAPEANREAFFGELLKLNATDMVHGAYALEEDNVIIIDSLVSETLDLEEFQASIDAIGFALSQHYAVLAKYRKKD
ncbi:MAG: hypothetical protein P8107_04845 [Spirochaetia bacterium]|jgi:hypothetical protein